MAIGWHLHVELDVGILTLVMNELYNLSTLVRVQVMMENCKN